MHRFKEYGCGMDLLQIGVSWQLLQVDSEIVSCSIQNALARILPGLL